MEHGVFVKYNFKRVDGSTEKVRCLVDERKRCHDTQQNDIPHNENYDKNFNTRHIAFNISQTQHNDIHHNDTQHYNKKYDPHQSGIQHISGSI